MDFHFRVGETLNGIDEFFGGFVYAVEVIVEFRLPPFSVFIFLPVPQGIVFGAWAIEFRA